MAIFNVKDKSLNDFMMQHANGIQCLRASDMNPYYLMKDTIILKKTCGLNPGQTAIFELMDKAQGSGRALINHYEYVVHEYDSVSVLLHLSDFRILSIDGPNTDLITF